MDYLEDFVEFADYFENIEINRIPRRYIRDGQNPFEFYSDIEFKRRFRFHKEQIRDVLLPLVRERLIKINQRGVPISIEIQFLVCLRFYATGSFQVVQGDLQNIHQATISRIIKRVSICLAERTAEYIKFPETEQTVRANIAKFYGVAGFPCISGCVDCTHIPIANPGGDIGEVYRNRKRFFSLNVQVVSGSNLEHRRETSRFMS